MFDDKHTYILKCLTETNIQRFFWTEPVSGHEDALLNSSCFAVDCNRPCFKLGNYSCDFTNVK